MLPKAHLTLHSRMSGSGWVIVPSWLSRSWGSFCTVFLCIFSTSSYIFCFCYVHTVSVLYYAHLYMKYSLVSLVLFKTSLFFPILLFSSISLHWLLKKAFLSVLVTLWDSHSNGYIFPFLLCLSLLFFHQLFLRPPQTIILPFCTSFSWEWSLSLPPVQCQEHLSIVFGTLSIRYNPLNLFIISTV